MCVSKRNIAVCSPEAKSGNVHRLPVHSTGVKGSGCACNNNIKRMYWDCQRLVPICGMCIVENVGVEASNVKQLTLYNSVICVDCQRLVLVVALN